VLLRLSTRWYQLKWKLMPARFSIHDAYYQNRLVEVSWKIEWYPTG